MIGEYGRRVQSSCATHLETDSHDDIWLTLLGLIWLNARIYELHQLIEDSLRIPSSKWSAGHIVSVSDAPSAQWSSD